jgi:hypothetical protein
MSAGQRMLDKDRGLLEMREPPPAPKKPWWWFFTGVRPEPSPSHLGLVEGPDKRAIGICCSGGGIRSAAFNLGALQALQERKVLQKCKYLAAVSGGSYIAAAFCMVAKRGTGGGHDDSDDSVSKAAPPFYRMSPEEQYLRNRCSYLAPDGLSKLFLAYRVLLGLVFNLIFLGLALFTIGAALAWAVYAPLYDVVDDCTGGRKDCNVAANVPDFFWWLLTGLGVAIVLNGLLLLLLRPKSEFLRRGLETWATRLILAATAVAVVFVGIPLIAPILLESGDESVAEAATTPELSAVSTGSFLTVLAAVLLQLRARAAEPATVLKAAKGARAWFTRQGSRTRTVIAYIAGALAGPLLLLSIVVLAAAWALASFTEPGADWEVLIAAALAAVLFGLLYFIADLNTWSLHPFYRDRLCRAFALKRVMEDGVPVARQRDFKHLVQLSQSGVEPTTPGKASHWPTLLVCAAANVSDPGATPPGRGVTSFTFSATAIGGPLVGASETKEFEDRLGRNRARDITLPAAVAMSGAALSPSMGKQTRRPLTFLLALANVRLGVWVPNPRHVGETWTQRGPGGRKPDCRDVIKMPRPSYLFRELLGRNRVDAKFLYVSDGGHYENLGLVELLRRGCTKIFCFDASGGDSFTALGDAIALARSELGVEVDIDPVELVPDKESHLAARDCAHGTITYADGTEGVLIYARTVMTSAVPFDVTAYYEDDPRFPHHSTADQLYTDQKFEAYRALGHCAGKHAVAMMKSPSPVVKQASAPAAVPTNGAGEQAAQSPT